MTWISCPAILPFSLFNRLRWSLSITVIRWSIKTRRSNAPSPVTSITFMPKSSSFPAFNIFWSNKEVLIRLTVGNLSIAAPLHRYSSILHNTPWPAHPLPRHFPPYSSSLLPIIPYGSELVPNRYYPWFVCYVVVERWTTLLYQFFCEV